MKKGPLITLIALHSRDGFISKGTGVPWQLPADKEQFRSYTRGKWLLLGRKTYEEMLGWFSPEQTVLVLSRKTPSPTGPGRWVKDVAEALELTKQEGAAELVVCGGGGCYAAAIPYATRLILTEVDDLLYDGVRFPSWNINDWQLCSETNYEADEHHAHGMTIHAYQKKR